MDKTLFELVMEADEGRTEAADDLAMPDMDEGTESSTDTASTTDTLDELPQDDAANDLDFNFDDSGDLGSDGGGDNPSGDDNSSGGDDNSDDGDGDKKDESLSNKVSNILNSKLYKKFLSRNQEISDILEDLSVITPVLPYDVVTSNDTSVSRLHKALEKGKEYTLSKFLDSSYGENLTYFRKIDTLYKILLNSIDVNLKKFNK